MPDAFSMVICVERSRVSPTYPYGTVNVMALVEELVSDGVGIGMPDFCNNKLIACRKYRQLHEAAGYHKDEQEGRNTF